ncbi:MAG: DUF2235 domain-containing protein [Rhodobacteraceae bacterium]|nr:DUF2235 domain-containing protein [Paracoccaceae bacterium]
MRGDNDTESLWGKLVARLKSTLRFPRRDAMPAAPLRAPKSHIIIIDGTQSRLHDGEETNAGLLYKLLQETHDPQNTTLWYHPGIQGHGFRNWVTIASGWGINQLIFDGYAQLAAHYQPGDRIYLFGYSRGAYAVRSIAGMIGRVGLVRQTNVNKANLRFAFRLYESQSTAHARAAFKSIHCHGDTPIEMIGVWDTVKALGIQYPLLTYLAPMATEFHSTTIGGSVKAGYHALALDEDRRAYAPVMWDTEEGWSGHLEQVWFRGAHGDVGGHVYRYPYARPLANIPLVWMCEKSEDHGLTLPEGWRARFPTDRNAPAMGARAGIGRFFLLRAPRELGKKPGESMHISTGSARPLSPYSEAATATGA